MCVEGSSSVEAAASEKYRVCASSGDMTVKLDFEECLKDSPRFR